MDFNKNELNKILSEIKPADAELLKKARERLDSLVKPPGSLGALEDIAARLAAATGELYPETGKRTVIIFASDNGVVEEGVAAAPQQVTLAQTINFTRGITGVAVLAKTFGADLTVIDAGINGDLSHPGIIGRKIRKSTGNIAKEPAMSDAELYKAISIGVEAAKNAKDDGYKLIGAGEMGIGNTTTSSAVLCALSGFKTEEQIMPAVGKGAGLTDELYDKKISVIKKALDLHLSSFGGPLEALKLVGGFDIAAMAGVYIGAARYRLPVVIDGFISAVAALCAFRLNPVCRDFMFPSHHSRERGFAIAMEPLGLTAPLRFEMRLGEGSGCPLMFAVMDGAAAIIRDMATFEEASIPDEYLNNIKDAGKF